MNRIQVRKQLPRSLTVEQVVPNKKNFNRKDFRQETENLIEDGLKELNEISSPMVSLGYSASES